MRIIIFHILLSIPFFSTGINIPDSVKIIIKGKLDQEKIMILDSLSNNYGDDQCDIAVNILQYAAEIAKKNKFDKKILKLYRRIISRYRFMGLFDQALSYIDSSKTIASSNKLYDEYSDIFDIEGLIHLKKMDYNKAAQAFYSSIRLAEKINDSASLHDVYNHLGILSFYRKDDNSAIKFYKRAIDFIDIKKTQYKYIFTIDNIAICYSRLNKVDSAFILQKQVLDFAEKDNDTIFFAECNVNIGSTLIALKRYQEAEKYLLKGYEMHSEIGNDDGMLIAGKLLGELYFILKKNDIALNYFNDCYSIADKLNVVEQKKEVSHNLALLYKQRKDYEKAAYYFEIENTLTNEILKNENTKAINELTVQYESEKKMQKIQLLEKDKKIKEEEVESERNQKYFISVVVGLFVVISILLLIGFSQKKKDNKLLSQKNNAIELQKKEIESQRQLLFQKNIEITDSINYAKRIQALVLPSLKYFQSYLPQSYIYFLPKDIISGDFYWITKKNNYLFVAMADCTGHGVPGAMMSMLGASLLNKIIKDDNIIIPSEILISLHKHLIKTLNEDTKEQESVDGMDLSLIRIDVQNKEIVFAGAGRPLYCIREGILTEYKSDKFAIGGQYMDSSYTVTDQNINYKNSAIQIVLFSDGITDQFGGEKGKKFMATRLKEVLIESSALPVTIQEEKMRNSINDWMGNYDQVDDMTLISIFLS